VWIQKRESEHSGRGKRPPLPKRKKNPGRSMITVEMIERAHVATYEQVRTYDQIQYEYSALQDGRLGITRILGP
jgi:hypothetical protein